jgi:energy-coupling factor transport system permease protein
MAVMVPLGQFVPGDSAIHRLEPRVKLSFGIAYALMLFAVSGWPGLAAAAAFVVVAVVLSSVPWRLTARGLAPIMWLLVLTFALNSLTWGSADELYRLGPVAVSAGGVGRGAFFVARISLLVLGTSLVTLTTSPVALTDALSQLMRPLRHVGVPVDDVAMMFSIALRFIPTTAEEADRIVTAQSARGARFDEGGPIERARAWLPVLVPLFVNLFRRADNLAVAMESRCYGGVGRTRLHDRRMRAVDWIALVLGVTSMAAAAILLS